MERPVSNSLALTRACTFKTGVLNLVYGPAESTGDATYEDAKGDATYEDAKVHLAQPEQ
jgi:hypothetical protein